MAVTTKKRNQAPQGTRAQLRQKRARQKQTRRILYTSLAVLFAAGLAALLLWDVMTPKPGQYVPGQGNAHITEDQIGQVTYNTSPPTSGPHLGSLASWGVHDQPIANELQVHNLEDGGVIVHYSCVEGCPDLVAQLEEIVGHYQEGVILEPYPEMATRIALTGWQRIDQFDEFDEERIVDFIQAYRGDDHHR